MIDRPRVPLAAQVEALSSTNGFARVHFSFASDAAQRVPGLLLAATNATGRLPVVIVMHGTSGTKEGVFPWLEKLAKRGFLAVAIDGRYHGERTKAGKGTDEYNAAITQAWRDSREHPFYYDTVWDVMRLVDYLATRDDVDMQRIGVVGISKGGIETYLAAAADPRIAVAVPCIGVQSFRWALDHNDWQGRIATVQKAFNAAAKEAGVTNADTAFVRQFYDRVVPGIYGEFDGPAMLPLIAPRPLLVINGDSDDHTPLPGVQECVAAAQAAYRTNKAEDQFAVRIQEKTGHKVTDESETAAIEWFVKWLGTNHGTGPIGRPANPNRRDGERTEVLDTRPLNDFEALLGDIMPWALWALPHGFTIEGGTFPSPSWVRGGVTKAEKLKHEHAMTSIRNDPMALDHILKMLENHDQLALNGFFALGDLAKPAIPELDKMLDDDSKNILAARALAMIGPGAFEALGRAITNRNRLARVTAIAAFGFPEFRTNEVIPPLLRCLNDSDVNVQCVAATALGRTGLEGEHVVPALISHLDSSNANLQISAAMALGNYGTAAEKAIPNLQSTLDDPDAGYTAVVVLSRIGPGAADALVSGLTNRNDYVRIGAAQGLAEIHTNTPAAVSALIRSLKDKRSEVRSYSAYGLGRIQADADKVVPALIGALADESASVRQQAVESLGQYGEKARPAVKSLQKLFNDDSLIVKNRAKSVLGALGVKGND